MLALEATDDGSMLANIAGLIAFVLNAWKSSSLNFSHVQNRLL